MEQCRPAMEKCRKCHQEMDKLSFTHEPYIVRYGTMALTVPYVKHGRCSHCGHLRGIFHAEDVQRKAVALLLDKNTALTSDEVMFMMSYMGWYYEHLALLMQEDVDDIIHRLSNHIADDDICVTMHLACTLVPRIQSYSDLWDTPHQKEAAIEDLIHSGAWAFRLMFTE
jgi:hypothetical protein